MVDRYSLIVKNKWLSICNSNEHVKQVDTFLFRSAPGYIIVGFVKGFLLYSIPITLLKRKLRKTTLHRSTAIGIFFSVFRLCFLIFSSKQFMNFISQYFYQFKNNVELQKKFSSALSGSFAILFAQIIDSSLANSLFVCWFLTRAGSLVIPKIPFGSTIGLCWASSQIGASWVRSPDDLDPSYRKFLGIQGGKSMKILNKLRGTVYIHDLCNINHPGKSCSTHATLYFVESFKRGLKLYAPLQLILFLLSSRKSVKYSLIGLLRSSLFMAVYCSFCWSSICVTYSKLLTDQNSKLTAKSLYLRGWTAGLALLIEKESKRGELAKYCITYALDTLYRHYVIRGIIQPNKNIHQFISCICWFIMLWNFKKQPKYLTDFLF